MNALRTNRQMDEVIIYCEKGRKDQRTNGRIDRQKKRVLAMHLKKKQKHIGNCAELYIVKKKCVKDRPTDGWSDN